MTISKNTKKKSKATGRGSKFCPSKFNDGLKGIIELLARRGFTDAEMAMCCGVSTQTFHNWKKAFPEFFGSLKNWKNEADEKVQKSLYERACGYSHLEDKIFNNNGEPLVVPTVKRYPPDTTACIFWLKNRQPEQWREKTGSEVEESLAETLSKIADKLPG